MRTKHVLLIALLVTPLTVKAATHPAGWADGSEHGAVVRSDGALSCTSCHGTDYRGGTSGVSCYQCHDGPGGHPVGWVMPVNHAQAALASGAYVCAPCHGYGYLGGWSTVSCWSCHNGPGDSHSVDWPDGSVHGSAVASNSVVSCRPCHGEDYRGGSSGVSCYTCHEPVSAVFQRPSRTPSLEQNHPNPFNPSTTIRFTLGNPARLSLRIYDLMGRSIATLIDNEQREAGPHELHWRGRDDVGWPVPAGVYFVKLTAGDFIGVRRMTLVK